MECHGSLSVLTPSCRKGAPDTGASLAIPAIQTVINQNTPFFVDPVKYDSSASIPQQVPIDSVATGHTLASTSSVPVTTLSVFIIVMIVGE